MWRTFQSQRQVERAPGFVGGRLLVDTGWTFWTLTVWESEQAMKKFRSSGAHARVMTRLPRWCNEAAYAHWVATADLIPTWDEAHQRLVAEHPSENHTKRLFARPRLQPLVGRDLKPTGVARQPA
jgi:heme-degrading monooxygenase HmoA